MGFDEECAICFEQCKFPVQLPCSHVFCFLCIKGSTFNISFRCALCRQDVPHDYFDHPKFLKTLTLEQIKSLKSHNEYKWYYEGSDGWWMYDDNVSQSLEKEFKSHNVSTEILTAGTVYIIDFKQMIQYRKNEPGKLRKVRREMPSRIKNQTKGIAGVKAPSVINDESKEDISPNSASYSASSSVDANFLSERLSQVVNISSNDNDAN